MLLADHLIASTALDAGLPLLFGSQSPQEPPDIRRRQHLLYVRVAFEWLNTAYQEHGHLLYGLRTDFALDSLRSDPRYAELVRKIGLPQ